MEVRDSASALPETQVSLNPAFQERHQGWDTKMLFDAALVTGLAGAFWLLVIRLRKGSLPPSFGRLDLRLPGFFIFAFALQLLLATLSVRGISPAQAVFPFVYLLSYLLLVYAALRNWHLFGMRIAFLGTALNLLVVTANLGHMPADLSLIQQTGRPDLVTSVESGRFPRQRPLTSHSRLAFLSDVLILPRPYPRPCVFSIGDVFITLGACWLILSTMGLIPANFGEAKRPVSTDESLSDEGEG